MGQRVEVQVPDIGDFKDVEVIEVLVKPGDTVKPEQSLITVESDKASMEIPSSAGGVVKELKVKLGDKVSQGSPLVVLEGDAARAGSTAHGRSEIAVTGSGTRKRGCACTCVFCSDDCSRGRRHGGSRGPRYWRLQGRRSDRGAGQARRHGQAGTVADHGRERQGVDGDSVVGGRCREGTAGQAWRQGFTRQSDRAAERRHRRGTGRAAAVSRRGARRPRPQRRRNPRRSPPKWGHGRSRSTSARRPARSRTPRPRCESSHANSASTWRRCAAAVRRVASPSKTCANMSRPSSRAALVRRRRRRRQARAWVSICRRGRSSTLRSSARSSASRCRASAGFPVRRCHATGSRSRTSRTTKTPTSPISRPSAFS